MIDPSHIDFDNFNNNGKSISRLPLMLVVLGIGTFAIGTYFILKNVNDDK